MDKKKYWVLRLFFLFFVISTSVAVLPCGSIIVHGLFGEVITSIAADNKAQEIVNIKSINHEKIQPAKGINIFNVWFEILIAVVWIRFHANLTKLPRGNTIVTLKIRMDN